MSFKGLAKRNLLEIARDPLTLILGIGAPSLLLLIFPLINASMEVKLDMFTADQLTPGIMVFGSAFLMMFAAILVCTDKQTSLFARFKTLPLRPIDFILGYSLPFLPISLAQMLVSVIIGIILGMKISFGILFAMLVVLVVAYVFTLLGCMLGSTLNEGQISGVGTMLIMVVSLLSGAWMPVKQMGGFIEKLCYALPFAHAVDAGRELIAGNGFDWTHMLVMLAYGVVIAAASIFVFDRKIKNSKN